MDDKGAKTRPSRASESGAQPFQGLIERNGRSYRNWGGSQTTRPSVYVEPLSYGDVEAVVRDRAQFPSPVHPVGAMLSVTPTVVNDGGTLLCTRKLDDILGLERDGGGRQLVRVQAGCRLKKLNTWLQARGLEVPFQAEIGEATVGSVAVGDTKESSLDAPGYFSAHVVGLVYVDEDGTLRTIGDRTDGDAFHRFKCSFGLSGIVVECLLEVRPATLCRSDVSVIAHPTPGDLAHALLAMRDGCDALFAVVILHQLAALCDQRHRAGPGATTPPSSQPACEEFRRAKRLYIQRGGDSEGVPQPKGLIYARHDFVNEYWRPTDTEPRLDFQYYEHDIAGFGRVLAESHRFTADFERQTGFAPRGWATYFVRRPETARKPFGLYSGGPGVSFSFDPFCSDPADERWHRFAREYNKLAIHGLGGNASPIQTRWLEPGDIHIPRALARPRFTTAYYEKFLA